MMFNLKLCAMAVCLTYSSLAIGQIPQTSPVQTPAPRPAAVAGNTQPYNPVYTHAKEINEIIRATMQAQNIPAISVTVIDKNQIVYSTAFGIANVSSGTPATTSTVFNLASISKPITAVAAFQLVEKGKMSLSAPVQDYVPSFPPKAWPVTIQSLLCHQSGIRHYKGRESLSNKRYTDVLDGMEMFMNDPLVKQPGTAYLYSSYGYNLLGAAVQGAASEPYLQYMQNNIFTPSGITGMMICDGTTSSPLQAVGYISGGATPAPASTFDATNKIPSGGFVCSSMDLARFASAFMNGKLLTKKSMDMMMTTQKLLNGKPTIYGLGWMITNWNSRKNIFHAGGQPGFSSLLLLVPEKGFGIAILTNLSDAKLNDLATGIRGVVVPY